MIYRRILVIPAILAGFFLLTGQGCKPKGNQREVVVRGKINFPRAGEKVSLVSLDNKGKPLDETSRLVEVNSSTGKFEYVLTLDQPKYYQLNVYDEQWVRFVADRSDIEINVDGKTRGFYQVNGSPDVEFVDGVRRFFYSGGFTSQSSRARALSDSLTMANENHDEKLLDKLSVQYQALMDKAMDSIASLMQHQAPLYGTTLVLIDEDLGGSLFFGMDRYPELHQHIAERLKKEWPNSMITDDFLSTLRERSKISVGKTAPGITLPDQSGNVVALSSFKGKYVLIDFWASWCGPCRAENPHLVDAYNRYHDKGLELLGVSLDANKEDWKKAIEEDGLSWIHVCDFQKFSSPAAELYGVSYIPFSVLVDPHGIIVAKNLRGEELKARLQSIFGM